MFHDVDWDVIERGNETRHQVRAVVTVVDDVDRSFVVTLEVFDKDTESARDRERANCVTQATETC